MSFEEILKFIANGKNYFFYLLGLLVIGHWIRNKIFEHRNPHLARCNKGLAYLKKRKYHLAIKEFDVLLEKDPKDWEALAYMADCYYFLGDFKQAIKFNERSIIYNKECGDIFENLALCYAETKRDIQESVDLLDKAKTTMRRNIKDYWDCVKELHYLSVGIVYFLHGQMPKAIELMKKATKLEDEDIFQKPDVFLTATLYYYSLMLAQTGDKYKADIYYMKAAKAGGKNNVFSQRAKGESNKFWKELGGGS